MNKKHEELSALKLSGEQQARLALAVEVDCVQSLLGLSAVTVRRADVEYALLNDPAGVENEAEIQKARAALRTVSDLARAEGSAARLTPELICRIHNPPDGAQEGSLGEPARARIDLACAWFAAGSFLELHPAEQAALVLLRLLEIRPFEHSNDRAAVLAGSLFTLRRALPPIIVGPELEPRFRAAIEEGLSISTRPMVELIAEALETSLARMKLVVSHT